MFYRFDIYYLILVMPALIFAMYAQFKVSSAFKTYSNYRSQRGYTGADVARMILNSRGINDVRVEPVRGSLTDHYDPRTKVVRLSQDVYNSNSLAAIGVAAHETGHAIQHQVGYGPLALRSSLVPVAGIGSAAGPAMAVFGLIFNWSFLTNLGILLFAGAVAFYLITLPVEFDASKRAVGILTTEGILAHGEDEPVRKVLSAAAMTYVASAAVAIANLLRLVLLASGGRRRD